jgi:hypothetical protein
MFWHIILLYIISQAIKKSKRNMKNYQNIFQMLDFFQSMLYNKGSKTKGASLK